MRYNSARQVMPGTLYVVATPIGNLEDVTLRALRVLREVSLIAAEDTRRTARLLQHYSISTPTTSLHEHNEQARLPGLIDRLTSGQAVALVSDAGTPVLSDPGSRLVAAAHAAGIRVEPVPGPSAVMAAVSATGLGGEGFVFVGFPPARSGDRRKWLRNVAGASVPVVLYEAPHRIIATLQDIRTELGERTIGIGRELTKAHEELAVRPISQWLASPPASRGEFVVVVAPLPASAQAQPEPPSDESIYAEFGHLIENLDLGRRAAIKAVAERHGMTSRAVFAAIERVKKLGD